METLIQIFFFQMHKMNNFRGALNNTLAKWEALLAGVHFRAEQMGKTLLRGLGLVAQTNDPWTPHTPAETRTCCDE